LDRYCSRVFSPVTLEPKVIHGRELTAEQLVVYIKAYAGLFASGAKFPTAATMLDATAAANNTNAVRMAIAAYKEYMDEIAGPRCNDFWKPHELEEEHHKVFRRSLETFDSIANFGSKRGIEEARHEFLKEINSGYEIYQSLNEGRNPLAGWETYGLPVILAIFSATFRWLMDTVCSAKVCRSTSEFLSHTHAVGWIFLALVAVTKFQQLKEMAIRVKKAVDLMSDAAGAKHGPKVKKE
jgi:atlastin